MTKFVGLRAKIGLIDDGREDKKVKGTKKRLIERKLKFENYENCLCLGETQLDNKINYLEKNKIDIDSVKKNYNEFMKSNISVLKTQQRFKSEKHNVLSSNDNKRMQSIDSIETYAYGTSKDLVSKKEDIKCNNIIKQYKKY